MKIMTKKEMKKIQDKMLEGISDFQINREPTHIELMNEHFFSKSLMKRKKDRKVVKRGRVLGMGEATKLTAKSKDAGKINRSSKITVNYRGLKSNQ